VPFLLLRDSNRRNGLGSILGRLIAFLVYQAPKPMASLLTNNFTAGKLKYHIISTKTVSDPHYYFIASY